MPYLAVLKSSFKNF